MVKTEFLKELTARLSGLSSADIESSVEYYSEMIDERLDSGMNESEAIAELGTPKEIARDIKMNLSVTKLIKSKLKLKRSLKVWEIIALILGSPIWLSLLVTILAIAFSVYVVIWSVYISIFAIDISAAAGGAALSFASFFNIANSPANAVLCIGIGLCAVGLGIFCFLPCLNFGKIFVKATVATTKYIKSIIVGKDK